MNNGKLSRRTFMGTGLSLALTPRVSCAAPADDTDLITMLIERGETIPPRAYAISKAIELRSGQSVILASGARVVQRRPNTPVFTATGARGLRISGVGAELWGEGSWSRAWFGNGGHDDRGIFLKACEGVEIDGVSVRNCAHSGIAIVGGRDIQISGPVIEGTHRLGGPIPPQGNFQIGIYLRHDPQYGSVDRITIENPDISGTAQGILSELEMNARPPIEGITITDAHIHDIPGQHAMYLQAGATKVIRPVMDQITLAGIKIQSGDANAIVSGVTVVGAIARDLGSQMFEVIVAPPFQGWVRDIELEGTGTRVARAIAIGRRVQGFKACVTASDISDTGVELNGEELRDISIDANLQTVGQDGIAVYAKQARDIRIRATVRNANASGGSTACGIRVASPSAEVTLVDPDIDDTAARMHYGLFNSISGSVVRIEGTARFTGAAQQAVRATGAIEGLPSNSRLSGKSGRILDTQNVRLRSS